jgi:hypothetical protein
MPAQPAPCDALARHLAELCRVAKPDLDVTVHMTATVSLWWDGHEHRLVLDDQQLRALDHAPQALVQQVQALIGQPPQTSMAASIAEAARLSDREALDATITLTRHLMAMLEPEATVTFEEYAWHGELTLDILVSLRGHAGHLEVSASRAHMILPDYEWELRRDDLQDEVLYHDLEELVRDLHRAARTPSA